MLKESELEDIESNLFASLRSSKSGTASKQKNAAETSKLFDINDDDLLDLLSDGEDDAVVKPKKKKDYKVASEEKNSPDEEHPSLKGDDDILLGSYIPSNNPTDFGTRPILKTPSSSSPGELQRKKSSVHFVEQPSLVTLTSHETSEPTIKICSNDTKPIDSKPVFSNTTLTAAAQHVSDSVSSALVSSKPLASSTTSFAVSTIPTDSSVSSKLFSSTNAFPNTTTTDSSASSTPVSTVSSPLLAVSPAVTTADQLIAENSVPTSRQRPALAGDGDDILQFGSYVPSNTPSRISGRRRQSPLTTVPGSTFERLALHDSSLTIAATNAGAKLPGDSDQSTMAGAPSTLVPDYSVSSQAIAPKTSKHLPSKTIIPTISSAPIYVTASPFSTPVQTIHESNAITSTPVSSPVAPAGTLRPTNSNDLEKQLSECKALLEKVSTERLQSLALVQSTQAKFLEVQKEKEDLAKLLDKARADLHAEKQLRYNERQSESEKMDSMREKLDESFKAKQESLQKLLKETTEKHQDEIVNLRREHEQTLSHWKDLLSSEQKSRRDEINKLQENQKKLMESLHSMDDKSSTSFKKLLDEMSDRMQTSVKQISDLCSSQNPHQTLEAACDRLATRQKECFQPLVQKVEEHLWQLEGSLLSERKKVEEERAKMFEQIQQGREALQKSKEHFFSEQQAWLSDSFTEKQHITRLQAKANETFTRNQKLETELSGLKASMDHEKNTLSLEQLRLLKEKQELELDKAKLDQDRQALLTLDQNLKLQELKINSTSQKAQELHSEGQQALATAQKMQENLSKKMIELQKWEESILTKLSQQSAEKNVSTPLSSEAPAPSMLPWQPTDSGNSTHMSVLSNLEHTQSIRNMISDSIKDDEKLEEESHFLQQLKIERRSKNSLK